MADSKESVIDPPVMEKIGVSDHGKSDKTYETVGATVVEVPIPVLISVMLMGKKKGKQRGIPTKVGGELGYAVRNARISELVEVPAKGVTTTT